jgi:sporulation protein YabP
METNINVTEKVTGQSKISLINRSAMSVNGVTKVVSATPSTVSLILTTEQLSVEGENLSITKLDVESKIVDLVGTINNLKFNKSSKIAGKNFFKRIFN